jgi:hypothetical protein
MATGVTGTGTGTTPYSTPNSPTFEQDSNGEGTQEGLDRNVGDVRRPHLVRLVDHSVALE